MIADRIEREILVEAPVETVWSAVTEPDEISRWWCDAAEIDLRPGGEGTLTWDQRATNERAIVRTLIESVEPPRTFSFRWVHPAGAAAHPGNSLLVEFTLDPEGEGTRVRLVESGWLGLEWPDARKTQEADVHSRGWDIHARNLRHYVARQAQTQAPPMSRSAGTRRTQSP